MTFEKIMEVFKEQFEIDKDIEVARFRRGYQFLFGIIKSRHISQMQSLYRVKKNL